MPILATRAVASVRGFGFSSSGPFLFTISTNQTNANLRTLAVSAGWDQSKKVIATINAGIYVSANGTGTPGLTVNGSFPGGVELVNNGFIVGMGGAGGAGGRIFPASVAGQPGGNGGLALSVSVAVTVTNNGTIGGGGGGGGGGAVGAYVDPCIGSTTRAGGGGGGGGRTGATNSSGGAAGTGESGGYLGAAGNPGTNSSAGTGGAGGTIFGPTGGAGGAGGGWGSAGSAGGNPGAGYGSGAAGAAGGAITGNSNITYITTGTRLGSIT